MLRFFFYVAGNCPMKIITIKSKLAASLLGFPWKKKKGILHFCGQRRTPGISAWGSGERGRNCILMCLWSGGTCLLLVGSSEISCQPFLNFLWSLCQRWERESELVRHLGSLILLILPFFSSGSFKSWPCVCLYFLIRVDICPRCLHMFIFTNVCGHTTI